LKAKRQRVANFLLDTNALIWLALGTRIGPETKKLISEADTVYISSLSIFELRIKWSSGKLLAAEKVISALDTMDLSVMSLTGDNLNSYRIFSSDNRDPFDNALVSVAISENLTLITSDQQLLKLKIKGLETIDAHK
jgi:PIN domain nuclease of toxin-antitoxin system